MIITNLTPHDINILRIGPDGGFEEVITIQRSGAIAHLENLCVEVDNRIFINDRNVEAKDEKDGRGVAFYHTIYGKPVIMDSDVPKWIGDFPDQKENTIYIVSKIFRDGFDRPDLWSPGKLVRNEQGQPIGCIGLSR